MSTELNRQIERCGLSGAVAATAGEQAGELIWGYATLARFGVSDGQRRQNSES